MTKYSEILKSVIHIDGIHDNNDIHPKLMCMKCYSTIRNVEKRNSTTDLIPKSWPKHAENCDICSSIPLMQKGRRKQTRKGKEGRPTGGNGQEKSQYR